MKVQVIEKKKGRIDRTTGEIIKGNLRVCAYARVSTEKEEQINSYNSQLKYYEEKIKSNSNWKYVEIYADEGITGTLDYKREGFMKMMQDATNNKFDMIITKSISRFGRNTFDTLKYVRLLKEKGITIYFEEEHINTLELSGEIMLTVMSAMAQQESENISSHVKLGLQMKLKRGELIGYNGCLGYVYDKESKQISVNYEEAEIVRDIFERYCQGVGCTIIAKELTSMKYSTPTGKKKWHESTIRGILKNEKYKGDVLQGKTYTTDPISHRRVVNMGEENMYYMQEHHEPIISERMFNQVQEILQKRGGVRGSGRRKGNFSRKYPFSSRLYCGFCGSLLTRRNWNSGTHNAKRVWQCTNLVKKGKDLCPKSKGIPEEILEECFLEAYKLLVNNNSEIIEAFISNMETTLNEIGKDGILEKIDKEIEKLNYKMNNLVDMKLEETITNDQFEAKRIKIAKSIEKKQKQRAEIEEEIQNEEAINLRLERFKEIFANRTILEEFDREVFECLIEKIIIGEEKEDGTYEMISGHRRLHAARIVGLKKIPAIVKEMSDDEAIIKMVDANIQREEILPSEKAKAYFMKYEAVKHQGKRGKGNSLDEVGETAGESAKTVQRYIYLAHLSDALLDMVDKKKIGIVQGVELSFLTEQQQEWVQVVLEETGMIISTVQASRLKEHGKSDELTLPMVRLILTEPKPIERKVTIKADKISRYFPEDYSNEQIENVIYQLLDKWNSSNSEK